MAFNPINYAYRDRMTEQRPNAEYKRFSEEYFSGADVRVYFGDTWIDEVTNLQFSLIENVAPIFGYASYTWDAVARGNRQIQGSFRINFKEAYYLHSITNRLELDLKGKKKITGPSVTMKSTDGVTIDHIIKKASSSDEKQFEELASAFEHSLWGGTSNKAMQTKANMRGNASWFYPGGSRPTLAEKGFSLLIAYGPYTEAQKINATGENVATTVHSLVGVQLTGVNQVIDGSGQPIQEEYSFIAKDLDVNVNL